MYSKSSSLITSMMGHTTRVLVGMNSLVNLSWPPNQNKNKPVLDNSRQQWLEPSLGAFTVCIEKGDHFTLRLLGANQPRPDQARSFARAHHVHGHGKFCNILFKLFTEVIWRKRSML